MKIGEINRSMALVLGVLVLAAGGWSWYSMLYKPATESAAAARATRESAQAQLDDAQRRLEEATKDDGGVDKQDVAKVQLLQKAIPKRHQKQEAIIIIDKVAKQTGVEVQDVTFTDVTSMSSAATLEPLDLTIKGHGTYASLQLFTSAVVKLVDVNRGKTYVTGPLMSVVKVQIERGQGTSGVGNDELPKGHQSITMVLRLFAEGKSAASSSATPGTANTPGMAAQPTGTTPAAAGTTPPPAGTTAPTGTTPPAAGSSTATPPADAGTSTPPPAGGAATPAGSG